MLCIQKGVLCEGGANTRHGSTRGAANIMSTRKVYARPTPPKNLMRWHLSVRTHHPSAHPRNPTPHHMLLPAPHSAYLKHDCAEAIAHVGIVGSSGVIVAKEDVMEPLRNDNILVETVPSGRQ